MEFIVEVIKPNIDLLMFLDEERRNIFQIAVAHRQEKVFSLIYGLDTIKYLFLPYSDRSSNWQANYHPNLRLSFNKSQEQLCKCKENYNAFSSIVIIMVKGQLEIVISIVLLAGIPIGFYLNLWTRDLLYENEAMALVNY
ncbi:hypothetical protein QQP08_011445, partial [Theobroma cacao]